MYDLKPKGIFAHKRVFANGRAVARMNRMLGALGVREADVPHVDLGDLGDIIEVSGATEDLATEDVIGGGCTFEGYWNRSKTMKPFRAGRWDVVVLQGHHDSPLYERKLTDMRAAHIDTIARRFPNLKVLMAHFSNPWWEEAWKVSWSRENVYADLSGGTAFRRSLNMWAEMFAPNGELMEDSLKKLCFACDVGYFQSGPHAFPPYIEFYQKLLDRLNAPKRLRKLVGGGRRKSSLG